MHPICVTVPEACRLGGFGRTFLYKLFETGALKPRKAGRRTLVVVAELRAYLEALPAGGCSNET